MIKRYFLLLSFLSFYITNASIDSVIQTLNTISKYYALPPDDIAHTNALAYCMQPQSFNDLDELNTEISRLIKQAKKIDLSINERNKLILFAKNAIQRITIIKPSLPPVCQKKIDSGSIIDLADLNEQILEIIKEFKNKPLEPVNQNGDRLIKNFQGLNTTFQALKAII